MKATKQKPVFVGPKEPTAKQAARYSPKDPHAESQFSYVTLLDGTKVRKKAGHGGNLPKPSN